MRKNDKDLWNEKTLKAVFMQHCILTLSVLVLLLIPLPFGSIFGSEGDWISQHVAVAESLRQAMREQKTLIPQWIGLGGGSSTYDFSYYGLLRPDVVLSCFFPGIKMKYIISAYALLGVVASVNLCFVWLRSRGLPIQSVLKGTVLFACASCFYHAHHQIMFVNYMPFLLLCLLGVDWLLSKNKKLPIIVALYFICVHSYYYAPTCIVVICLYFLYQWRCMQIKQENQWKTFHIFAKFSFCIIVSVGLAAVLLLPTAFDILSTSKDGGQFARADFSIIDWNMKGLLYTPYGCGLTLLVLYCLLLATGPLFNALKTVIFTDKLPFITGRKVPYLKRPLCETVKGNREKHSGKQENSLKITRAILAAILLAVMLFPVVSLLLNAFLYARAKILIPFAPLLVLVTTEVLEELYSKKTNYCYMPLVLCLLTACDSKWYALVFAEGTFLAIWIYIQKKGLLGRAGSLLIFLVPVGLSIIANATETYIDMEDDRQEQFSVSFGEYKSGNPLYRYDIATDYLVNCNLTEIKNETRATMYSSVTNADYAKFYYDIMHNPIRIQNRVALLAGENCFFRYFMGQRYLMTKEDDIPAGYQVLKKSHGYALSENPDVLPVCYGTSQLMRQSVYDRLVYPDTLEALCKRTIVQDTSFSDTDFNEQAIPAFNKTSKEQNTGSDSDNIFQSHMKPQKPDDFFKGDSYRRLLSCGKKEEDFTIPLSQKLENHVILISFDVESPNGDGVTISINGILNKLSSRYAPYPNENHTFTFFVADNKPISELFVHSSKGNYQISNFAVYTMDLQYMGNRQVYMPNLYGDTLFPVPGGGAGTGIMKGGIEMEADGYFVTSYPYKKGYYAIVDGKKTGIERVNTSFVGFPLSAGFHTFSICYETPGYCTGLVISIISAIIVLVYIIIKLLFTFFNRKGFQR